MNLKIQLQGLDCEACKKISEKRLSKIDGVNSVEVNLSQQTASIDSNHMLTIDEANQALDGTHYKVISVSEE